MPLNPDCLGRSYGPSNTQISDEMISCFLAATLDDGRAYHQRPRLAPPTLAFVPCWPVIQEALADADLGAAPGQIIHGEQVMKFHRPLATGDELTTHGVIAAISPKGRNELYVIHLSTTDQAGNLVVEQDNICISLGSAQPTDGAPTSTHRPEGSSKPPPDSAPTEPTLVASVEIPPDITHRYANASNDRTALHLDDDEARRLGFPGIIVHGMCLLSIAVRDVVSRLAGNDPRRIAELSVRFARPVQPGARLLSRYWLDGTACSFESVADDGRTALAKGRVVLNSE